MTTTRVAVVGAGLSGLSAAVELATSTAVTIIDRLPVTGGMTGWDDGDVRRMTEACDLAGVTQHLGTTALRWEESRLLLAYPGDIRWVEFDRLVFAGGFRPATRAELGIAGSRPAGVFPALVAKHLLEAGVRLGKRPVIVGLTKWSQAVAEELHKVDEHVAIVSTELAPRPPYANDWWPGWRVTSIGGTNRVEHIELRKGTDAIRLACDALILAAEPKPLRNVDGAVEGGANVIYAQPDLLSPTSARIARAKEVVRSLLHTEEEVPS